MPLEEAPRPYYTVGLSYVGGQKFLNLALASIEPHWKHVHVVNNTEPFVQLQDCENKWASWQEQVPVHPLTHTQTVNTLLGMASGLDAAFIMHCDAMAQYNTIDALLAMLPDLPRKWGVVFTNYDVLAMYNPKAFAAVGPWDWQNFPSYYSDNDWYRRLELAGYSKHESGLPVEHVGSHVINHVDKWRKFRTSFMMPMWEDIYRRKWGGKPGEEIFTVPFNLPQGPYADE